jgi:hypothetical protein
MALGSSETGMSRAEAQAGLAGLISQGLKDIKELRARGIRSR